MSFEIDQPPADPVPFPREVRSFQASIEESIRRAVVNIVSRIETKVNDIDARLAAIEDKIRKASAK